MHGVGGDPNAAEACARTGAGVDLREADVEVFGSGAIATVGESTFALALDRDRRWKIAFRGPTGEAEKTKVPPDRVAEFAVASLQARDCDQLARYAFVYIPTRKWCRQPFITGLQYDLSHDLSAKLRPLGGDRGLRFYGVSITGPHYYTMVLANMNHYYVYYNSYRAL
jgi:hypothetical protein